MDESKIHIKTAVGHWFHINEFSFKLKNLIDFKSVRTGILGNKNMIAIRVRDTDNKISKFKLNCTYDEFRKLFDEICPLIGLDDSQSTKNDGTTSN